MQIRHRNEALNPAQVCRAETASLAWTTLSLVSHGVSKLGQRFENTQRSASRFPRIIPCQNIFNAIHGF
jgi:hypothetical protein